MHLRVLALASLAFVLAGCPSKEGEQRDANAGGQVPPPQGGGQGGGSGPLAGLESSPFMNEVWNAQGQQTPILFYARENVRVSAQCRTPTGQLQCAALQQLRNGMPVEIPRRELDGRASAGVKACTKLGFTIVTAFNQVGDEESFCRFPDGSLLSTGTLERYGVRALQ